jgi:O-antigen/teichoic acid export membrane protein
MFNQDSIYKKIIVNTSTQFGSRVVSVLLSLISVGLLTRYLGTDEYGNFTLVFTYISFFAVLSDIGFNQVVVREFASGKEKGVLVKASLLNLKLILTILSIIFPILALYLFPYSNYLKGAIIIGAFAVAVGNMVSYGTSILQSQLSLDLVALLDLLMKLVTVIAVFCFTRIQLNLYFIIGTVFIGNFVGLVAAFLFVKKHIAFRFYLDTKLTKRMLKLGVPVGISAFLALLYFKVDTIMLSLMRSSTEVGIYSLSFRLLENILMLWGLYMASIFPLWSKFFANSEYSKYKSLLRDTLLVLFGLSIVVIFCGYAFSPLIMRVLGGSKFFSSMQPFKILLLATPFFFLNSIFYYIILSFGKTKYLLLPLVASLFINILINLYAIPKYGYIGTSVTTVITEIFTSLFYLVIFIRYFKSEVLFFIKI